MKKGWILVVLLAGCVSFGASPPDGFWQTSPNFKNGKFVNFVDTRTAISEPFKIMGRWFFGDEVRTPKNPLPTSDSKPAKTKPGSGLRVTWFGHSTALIEIEDYVVLTDPIWGNISPPGVNSLDRFFQTPIDLNDLPELDAIVISHDHYDHLDIESVFVLAETGVPFVVPLGVGSHLREWDVPESQIVELDWWETWTRDDLVLTATPARHFSGRGLKRDTTLWASWSIRATQKRVFFGGDTGMTEQFDVIGEKEGPFDITLMPIGAYDPMWSDIHLNPEEALKVHKMVRGNVLIPIHWGTFQLAIHDWFEPPERLISAAANTDNRIAIPLPGQPVDIAAVPAVERWWQGP